MKKDFVEWLNKPAGNSGLYIDDILSGDGTDAFMVWCARQDEIDKLKQELAEFNSLYKG